MKNVLTITLLTSLLLGCSSLQTTGQYVDRFSLKIKLKSILTETHEKMSLEKMDGALLVIDVGDTDNIVTILGNSPLEAALSGREKIKDFPTTASCFHIPAMDNPSKPIEQSCSSLLSEANIILSLKDKIEELESVINENTDAILSSFRLAATSSNITVVQAEHAEVDKQETSKLKAKVNSLDSKISSLQSRVDSQLNTIINRLSVISRQISSF